MTAAGAPDPAALAAVSRGTLRAAGPDGLPRIYAFTDLPGTETKIVVGIEEREALGRIERTLSLAYLQLGVFGLLALLLAWFCGEHYIIAPIRTLARIAANIGRGELEHRLAPARWTVEFAPLAAALDDMALKFAERESALQAANRHLEELALVDALSGLSNRRAFERHFGHALKAAGPGVPISLLMIDVDRFKEFNDTYGHPEGDNCLRLIAKALESAMRPGDLTTRYGGEEFAVLLPGVDCAVAVEAAERCRLAVERMRIRHDAVASGFVTISIGVATRHADEPGGQQALIAAADAALYEAKRRGRNRALAWSKAMVAQAGPAPAILDKDEEKRPKQAA